MKKLFLFIVLLNISISNSIASEDDSDPESLQLTPLLSSGSPRSENDEAQLPLVNEQEDRILRFALRTIESFYSPEPGAHRKNPTEKRFAEHLFFSGLIQDLRDFHKNTYATITKEAEAAKASLNELQHKLHIAEEKVEALRHTNKSAQEDSNSREKELQETIATLNTEKTQLEWRIKELDEFFRESQARNLTLEKRVLELEEDNKSTKEQLLEKEESLRRLLIQLEKKAQELEEAREKTTALEELKTDALGKLDQKEDEIEELSKNLAKAEKKLAKEDLDRESDKKKLAILQANDEKMKKTNREHLKEAKRQEKLAEERLARIKQLEAQLVEARNAHEAIATENAELKDMNKSMGETMTTLREKKLKEIGAIPRSGPSGAKKKKKSKKKDNLK